MAPEASPSPGAPLGPHGSSHESLVGYIPSDSSGIFVGLIHWNHWGYNLLMIHQEVPYIKMMTPWASQTDFSSSAFRAKASWHCFKASGKAPKLCCRNLNRAVRWRGPPPSSAPHRCCRRASGPLRCLLGCINAPTNTMKLSECCQKKPSWFLRSTFWLQFPLCAPLMERGLSHWSRGVRYHIHIHITYML